MLNVLSGALKTAFLSVSVTVASGSSALASYLKCWDSYVYESKIMNEGLHGYNYPSYKAGMHAYTLAAMSPEELKKHDKVLVSDTYALQLFQMPRGYGQIRSFLMSKPTHLASSDLKPVEYHSELVWLFENVGIKCGPG